MNFLLHKTKFKSEEKHVNNELIFDSNYWDFINLVGDGFFFHNSFHLFGKSENNSFHDLIFRTELIKSIYKDMIPADVVSFGEDLFGNHFVYSSEGIGLFQLETAEIEYIASDFHEFIGEFTALIDYYTGESLAVAWLTNHTIDYEERLAPKLPFIVNGLYEVENLYKINYVRNLQFHSDLAIQIKNLPDGTTIKFDILPE